MPLFSDVEKAKDLGISRDFPVVVWGLVSHLQFADDTLFL